MCRPFGTINTFTLFPEFTQSAFYCSIIASSFRSRWIQITIYLSVIIIITITIIIRKKWDDHCTFVDCCCDRFNPCVTSFTWKFVLDLCLASHFILFKKVLCFIFISSFFFVIINQYSCIDFSHTLPRSHWPSFVVRLFIILIFQISFAFFSA